MKTAAFLTICAAVLATGVRAQGVNPTAPQAEDKADVGDVGDDVPAPAKQIVDSPAGTMSDTSDKARAEAYFDATRTYEEHARDLREQLRELAAMRETRSVCSSWLRSPRERGAARARTRNSCAKRRSRAGSRPA